MLRRKFVLDSPVAYNRAHAPDPKWDHLRFFLRDEQGAIHGGLLAEIYFGWLYVSILWVAEAHRGEGWGQRLLARAEEEGAARGCRHVWLDTFSFQAPGFYQKLGYKCSARWKTTRPARPATSCANASAM